VAVVALEQLEAPKLKILKDYNYNIKNYFIKNQLDKQHK
jgi:hypothetical protein